MKWLLYSPNLNSIEHVWAELKKLVYKLHPELYSMKGPEDALLEKIKSAVYEASKLISDKFLYSLIDSMQNWVEAVRRVHGRYT